MIKPPHNPTQYAYLPVLSLLFVWLMAACGSTVSTDDSALLVTPTLPDRSDVQIPGLVELVDAEKNAPDRKMHEYLKKEFLDSKF